MRSSQPLTWPIPHPGLQLKPSCSLVSGLKVSPSSFLARFGHFGSFKLEVQNGSPSRDMVDPVSGDGCFLIHRWCLLTWWKGYWALCILFHKTLIPSVRLHPHDLSSSQWPDSFKTCALLLMIKFQVPHFDFLVLVASLTNLHFKYSIWMIREGQFLSTIWWKYNPEQNS